MRKRIKQGLFFLSVFGLLLATGVYPAKISKSSYSGVASVIKIKSKRVSPAFSAFEDLYDVVQSDKEMVPIKQEKIILISGLRSNAFKKIVAKKIEDNRNFFKVANASKYKMLRGVRVPSRVEYSRASEDQWLADNLIKDDKSTNYLEESTAKVQKQNIRKIYTQMGAPIIIASHNVVEPTLARGRYPGPPPRDPIGRRGPQNNQEDKGSGAPEIEQDSLPVTIASSDFIASGATDTEVVLSGEVQIEEGLPFVPSEMYFKVVWSRNNVDVQYGEVNSELATFTLPVTEKAGVVFVELWSHEGFLVGLGELNLADTKSLKETLKISVYPVSEELTAALVTLGTEPRPFKGQSVEARILGKSTGEISLEKSTIKLTGFHKNSTVPIQVIAEGHWGSVASLMSTRGQRVKMYPEKTMKALIGLTVGDRFYDEAKKMSAVWGRVTLGGEPVRAATVEISSQAAVPIYFSGFVPNSKTLQTTDNGKYAMLFVEPGRHRVRVKVGDKYYAAQLVETQRGSVTEVNIDIKQSSKSKINIYDAFTGEYLASQLQVVGEEIELSLPQGRGEVLLSSDREKIEIDTDPGKEYIFTRQRTAKLKQIDIPGIKKSWKKKLLIEAKINISDELVSAVGFVEGEKFKLTLPSAGRGAKVVYFNKAGALSKTPQANGGFVVVNMTPGEQQIIIEEQHGEKVFSDVFLNEEGVVSLLRARLDP